MKKIEISKYRKGDTVLYNDTLGTWKILDVYLFGNIFIYDIIDINCGTVIYGVDFNDVIKKELEKWIYKIYHIKDVNYLIIKKSRWTMEIIKKGRK